MIKAEFLHH